ncbi:MAG TPA: DUF5916 domain-containing protein [Gemmatimonadales bacterium]|nr:DUF5916 domain-containing protein [Gemmatimonadales bacterium]
MSPGLLAFTTALAALAQDGAAQSRDPVAPAPAKQLRAVRLQGTGGSIQLDGRLDDAVWSGAVWIKDFIQKIPNEGAPPSDTMQLAIFYDDDALYVGARMYSRDPSRIQAPLSRRDNTSQADHLWVSFDSYHDRRTAYSFGVTASGVRMDWYHATDSEFDLHMGFDPVWDAKANIDALGWTAEMRIPFSQLRFNDTPVQVWGFNADHWNPATSEDVFWIPVPKDRNGWSSFMGELVGIEGIKPSRRLEVMPYGAVDSRVLGEVDAADPFNDKANFSGRVGADLKMGLGPNITLDATVNPDFGQVEADPAIVNLSGFEFFFDERRPFFTEGSRLLQGSGPSYYYSRRIGARPGCNASGDYVDCPPSATILGAAKVTGRLAGGMSLGALAAVTSRESARTYDAASGTFGRTELVPPAGYGVMRVQQEFGASKSVIGVTLTTVQRDLDSLMGLRYTRRAYSGGADWVLRWDRGAYELRGYAGLTHLRGDSSAIDRVQRSPVHYFQRPDADYITYDPSRTSFTGSVGSMWFRKTKGSWLYDLQYSWESPAYDPNDAGRLGNADGYNFFGGLIYRHTKPGRWFQSYNANTSTFTEYDFGGTRQVWVTEVYGQVIFKNFWDLSSYVDFQPRSFDHSATRGGPQIATAQTWNWVVRLASAFGAKTGWVARVYYGGDELGSETYRISGELSIRPSSRFQFSATPNYLRDIQARQYVMTVDTGGAPATYDKRYVFGAIDQSTFLVDLRANYTIGPDLTVELWGEPFAANGRYYGLGELAAPRTFNLRGYGTSGTTIARDPSSGDYTVTDGPSHTVTIPNPDFNFVSFRSNAVLRWEWRPGSTLYVVWAQDRGNSQARIRGVGFRDLVNSFGAAGDNFFAVKVSYWIPVN